jgi:2'-5' RNA ligase
VDAFEFTLDHAGLWARQRVAWLAPRVVPPALSQLVGELEAALRGAHFAVEDRVWRAHVTLLRDTRSIAAVPAPQLRWQARDFVLVESAGGAYRIVKRWPLQAI